jgi:hypothetical protein
MFCSRRSVGMALAGYWALAAVCNGGWACLRHSMDDRAVQWSTLIVQGKLLSAGALVALPTVSTTRPALAYQLCDVVVEQCLNGQCKAGDHLRIIRYLAAGTEQSSLCGEGQVKDQIGKSFILLLRPQDQVKWSNDSTDADPRTPQINDLKAFIIVHLESVDDLGKEGLEDLKYTVSNTRAAEGAFNADDAKLQAQTLVRAADDTEADQAEHALMEMGPKAVDAIQTVAASASDAGRQRLDRLIDSLSPPPIDTPEQLGSTRPGNVQ